MDPIHVGTSTESEESEEPGASGAVSGFRSVARAGRAATAAPNAPSAMAVAAAVSWLLTLSVLGVAAAKLGFDAVLCITGVQMGVVLGLFMRFAWDRRFNWVLLGLGAVTVALLSVAALADRKEYQPELDRFESPGEAAAPAP
jgi:hypothetical protein